MNRLELFKKTEDVLYKAYFDGTLKHNDCSACAVGNICLEAANVLHIPSFRWKTFFFTNGGFQYHNLSIEPHYTSEAQRLINATGYTVEELAKIEFAFETAPKGEGDEDYMFNGLVDVLEVLRDIHDLRDEDIEIGKFREVHARNLSTVTEV